MASHSTGKYVSWSCIHAAIHIKDIRVLDETAQVQDIRSLLSVYVCVTSFSRLDHFPHHLISRDGVSPESLDKVLRRATLSHSGPTRAMTDEPTSTHTFSVPDLFTKDIRGRASLPPIHYGGSALDPIVIDDLDNENKHEQPGQQSASQQIGDPPPERSESHIDIPAPILASPGLGQIPTSQHLEPSYVPPPKSCVPHFFTGATVH